MVLLLVSQIKDGHASCTPPLDHRQTASRRARGELEVVRSRQRLGVNSSLHSNHRRPVSTRGDNFVFSRDLQSNKLVTVSESLFDGLTKLEFL